MTAPRVSIVLIFLNEERFLQEAIESIRAQSFADWELLLVDDGSGDNSSAIAEKAARQDPARIRGLTHPGRANRGMSASRNLGIALCRGDFVTFVDGDDSMPPGKLEHYVRLLELNPQVAGVAGPSVHWRSWQGDLRSDQIQDLGFPPGSVVPPPSLVAGFVQHPSRAPGAFMVRRSLLIEEGGYDDSFPGMFEDQVALAKLFLTRPILVTSHTSRLYRQHDNSAVATAFRTGQRRVWRQRFLEWLKEELKRRHIRDRSMRQLIRRELWKCRYQLFLDAGNRAARLARKVLRILNP